MKLKVNIFFENSSEFGNCINDEILIALKMRFTKLILNWVFVVMVLMKNDDQIEFMCEISNGFQS